MEKSYELLLGGRMFDNSVGAMYCWLGFSEVGGWVLYWLESFGIQGDIP